LRKADGLRLSEITTMPQDIHAPSGRDEPRATGLLVARDGTALEG
jgi:hypothetical protein